MPADLRISRSHRVYLRHPRYRLDLTGGYVFSVEKPNGGRGTVALSTLLMTAALPMHLRAAGLPDNYTMHSFRVERLLSKSLAGTAVDYMKKIGGWTTEQVAWYHIGATTLNSAAAGSTGQKRDGFPKRKSESAYAADIDLPLPPTFQEDFAACARRYY